MHLLHKLHLYTTKHFKLTFDHKDCPSLPSFPYIYNSYPLLNHRSFSLCRNPHSSLFHSLNVCTQKLAAPRTTVNMDDPTFAERRGYSNIQFAPNLRRRISIFTSHFSRGVLLLTVALASVALFSIKYITTDHHVYVPLATASYGLLPYPMLCDRLQRTMRMFPKHGTVRPLAQSHST